MSAETAFTHKEKKIVPEKGDNRLKVKSSRSSSFLLHSGLTHAHVRTHATTAIGRTIFNERDQSLR